MNDKGLRILLIVHGVITLAAAIVLTVRPELIPSVVGVRLEPSANIIAYLLAGAEFGFAMLSFSGSRLTDPNAMRLVACTCIAFHGSSGILEVYAYSQGVSGTILLNVAARAIIIALFGGLSIDRGRSSTATR